MFKKIICTILLLTLGVGNLLAAFDYFPINPTTIASEGNYQGFASLVSLDSDHVLLTYRLSTGSSGELDDSTIWTRQYTISTNSWTTGTKIFDGVTGKSCLRPSSEVVDGVVKTIFQCATGAVDHGVVYKMESTGLTYPLTWNTSVVYTNPDNETTNPYGKWVETSDPNTFYIPVTQGAPGARVALFKTIDKGANWVIGPTVTANSGYQEAGLTYTRDGIILGFIRFSAGGKVFQVISYDNGNTWDTPQATNLGAASGIKVAYSYFDKATDTVVCIFVDRGDGNKFYFSKAKLIDALKKTSWAPVVYSGTTGLGYGDIIKIDSASSKFLVVNTLTISGSLAVIQYMVYRDFIQSTTTSGNITFSGELILN